LEELLETFYLEIHKPLCLMLVSTVLMEQEETHIYPWTMEEISYNMLLINNLLEAQLDSVIDVSIQDQKLILLMKLKKLVIFVMAQEEIIILRIHVVDFILLNQWLPTNKHL